jgi:outer membrane receptor protein involved in Fe transport
MRSILVVGARFDLVDQFKHIFSPRLHYKYKVTEKTDLRFTIGKAWRLPTIFQDNVSLMATGRTLNIPVKDEQEIMWNSGVSVSNSFKLWNRAASWTTDFYQTFFINQLVIDRDRDIHSIYFEYQKNTGTTSVLQTELSVMPSKVLTLRLAYKYLAVRARYNGIIQQQAMQPKNRILVNVAYQSRNKKWDFDATVSMISPMRMYGGHLGNVSQNLEFSPWIPMGLTQITYSLKRINFYIGAENLFNVKQENPIIDAENPFSSSFDATRIYAPITGIIVYTGFRLELTRKKEEK